MEEASRCIVVRNHIHRIAVFQSRIKHGGEVRRPRRSRCCHSLYTLSICCGRRQVPCTLILILLQSLQKLACSWASLSTLAGALLYYWLLGTQHIVVLANACLHVTWPQCSPKCVYLHSLCIPALTGCGTDLADSRLQCGSGNCTQGGMAGWQIGHAGRVDQKFMKRGHALARPGLLRTEHFHIA